MRGQSRPAACASQALVWARKGQASAEGRRGHLPWCHLRTCWEWASLAREETQPAPPKLSRASFSPPDPQTVRGVPGIG